MEVGVDEDTERRATSNQHKIKFLIVLLSDLKCQHHRFTSEGLGLGNKN